METRLAKKILVATDFSEGSDEALDRAIETAKVSGAEIEVLHVIELAEEFPFGTTYFDADYGVLYASVDRELARRADRARAAGLRCETKIIEGTATTDIIQRAQRIGADLVVVGTHGRTGLAHIVLGSVAERVVRRASCPVLTVPVLQKGGLSMSTATAAAVPNNIRTDSRPKTKGPGRAMESKGRILVVDDEVNARTALTELLHDEGYTVDAAADGFKALGKMADFAPDLVLTDLKMPGMDGIQLLGKIRESDPELPVVMMTAFGEVETAVGAMRAGARDYLSKPVNVGELQVVVAREMAARKLRAEAGLLRERLAEKYSFNNIVGSSRRCRKCSRRWRRSPRHARACSSPANREPARS
jgi:nucleotide-binding universal stress UspA family protein/CheY-like chemotaxis protein